MEGEAPMNENLLRGELVRLTHEDPEVVAKIEAGWLLNSEYSRLLDWDPARRFSSQTVQKNVEKLYDNSDIYSFTIRLLENDRIVGGIGLDGVDWAHRDSFVGIGLGEKEDWGKGYGTDAMKVILRYAFTELNLRRVSLDVFEYNPRGVRSYEKAGFSIEGRVRGQILREGRRWDVIFMGILREEWLKMQEQKGEL
jgi:RimJ/RimL family protein N-acetyltransferase